MKKLNDFDEFQQGIPRNKKMSDLETGRLHIVGAQYAKLADYLALLKDFVQHGEEQEEKHFFNDQLVKALLSVILGTDWTEVDIEEIDWEEVASSEIDVTDLSGLLADDQHVLDAEVTAVAVARALFDAYSILIADTDDIPTALTLAASTIPARLASGGIVAATPAQILAILTGTAPAAFNWNAQNLSNVGSIFIGDTANAGMTLGLTINQGATNDEIFALKAAAIGHGFTQSTETDTYGMMRKAHSTAGGLAVYSLYENVAHAINLQFFAYGSQAQTTKSTAGRALIEFYAAQHNGANVVADVTADGNVFGIMVRRASGNVMVLLLDEDGDLLLDGSITLGGGIPADTGAIIGARYVEQTEMSAPGAGAADTARVYALAGGDTLTDLCAVFQDGTVDVFAQESTPLDSPVFTQPSQTEFKMVMEKPHPGLIKFVAKYPDGKTFVLRELQYHDAGKIAANQNCEGTLPAGWEVTTLQERVDKQITILDEQIGILVQDRVVMELDLIKDLEDETDNSDEIYQSICQIDSNLDKLEAKKTLELNRIQEIKTSSVVRK